MADLRGYLGNLQEQLPAVFNAIFSGQEAETAARERQKTAVVAAADAQAKGAVALADLTIQEQEAHKQLLRAVGLDINDPQSALNKELQREQSSRAEREKLRTKITEMQSVNFWQNPLQFMMVQPELQQAVAQHNQLADVENRSTEEIARMQNLASTIQRLTPAKDADLIRKNAALAAEQVRQTAEATAAQISAQNAAGHAKALLDSFTLQRNIFSDALQLTNMEENIKDRRQRMEEQNFWRNIARQDRLEKEEEKRNAKNQETALVTGINLYRRAISGNTEREFTLEDVKRMPPQIREHWFEVIMRGNYGNSYGQSVPFIETYGNMAAASDSGNAAMMSNVRLLKNRAMEMVPAIKNKYRSENLGKEMKDVDALAMAYNQIYEQDRQLATKGADKSVMPIASPYAFDWEALAQQSLKAGGKGLIPEILLSAKSRAPGGNLNSTMTMRSLLDEVSARVVAGKVDPKTAAEQVAQFTALTATRNWEDAGLKYLNLPPVVDYVITPGATGKGRVDLMNPTQLESYLTSRIAAEKRAHQIGTNNPFFPWR